MAFFTGISSINKCDIIAIIDSTSIALSEGLDSDDLNMLGNLIVAIGSNIMTFALVKPCKVPEDKTEKQSKATDNKAEKQNKGIDNKTQTDQMNKGKSDKSVVDK